MEPTIYKPSIYKGAGIYKVGGGGGGGGGGIACIRCINAGKYIEIPINCSNRSKFELGFNLCGNWPRSGIQIFAGYGDTYHPPISLSDSNVNSNQYSVSCALWDNNQSGIVYVKNTIYPKNFNFYHAKIYCSGSNVIFELTDLSGNVISNSLGRAVESHAINKIRLFVGNFDSSGNDPGFEIYYFRVNDILDLVPDEQNGVPGFTDNISGNFYAPNDSTAFEAVKPRAPL